MQNSDPTLTYIQLVAIRGRVASELADCKNIADKKYKAFILVNIADYAKQNYAYFIDYIKECLDEDIVNEAYLFKSTRKVPVIYWVNKNREDILADTRDKSIIRSIFVSFMDEVIKTDAEAGKELIEEFKKDYRLSFLADLYIYLNEAFEDIPTPYNDKDDYLQKSKVYPVLFKNCGILSLKKELTQNIPVNEVLSNLQKNKFVVKKVLKGSGRIVHQKEFDTEEEADDYKQMILLQYPELSNDFMFIKEAKIN